MADNTLPRISYADTHDGRARRNIPGEHWLVLAGGLAMWLGTRRHPAFLVRLLGSIAGTVLVTRALRGTAVPRLMERLIPSRRDDS